MECKLCSKKFSNGKALGGHMRSHFTPLPLSPQTPQQQQQPISPKLDSKSKCGQRAKGLLTSDEMTKMGSGLSELGMGGDDDVAVAWCLIMLSRDSWESSENGDEIGKPVYRCERCEKVFKSSKGLRNHTNTTHFKKIKNSFDHNDGFVRDDAHKCPFCGKSFGSGQALGGHKKTHFRATRIGSISNDDPGVLINQ